MRTMHLFAGAGGGLLADLILGHQPVCAVEWDPYACRVLRERAADGWFPGLYVHEGDVQLFDPSQWTGRVDCIHAGFPCADISVAGSGAGIEGEHSGLWREVVRIAGVVRPGYLFLENSPAITSRGLGTILGDLAALGYDAQWTVLGASDVGAPHIRKRWWCLAWRNDADRQRQQEPNAPAIAAMAGQSSGVAAEERHRADSDCLRELQPGGSIGDKRERPGYGSWWLSESRFCGMVDGMATWLDRHWKPFEERELVANVINHEAHKIIPKAMLELWCADAQKEIQRALGGSISVRQAALLLFGLCGEAGQCDEAGIFMESEEDARHEMRVLRICRTTASASHRSGYYKQLKEKHPDAMQELPRFLAYSRKESGESGRWSHASPRVAYGVASGVDRIACLGNGQVPLCAATAWRILGGP